MVARPPLNHLIRLIDDCVGAKFLYAASTSAEFEIRAKLFHARLSIIIRGLDQAEIDTIYNSNAPSFFARLDPEEKEDLKDSFDLAHAVNEAYMVGCFREYAKFWISSPAGVLYKETFHKKR